MPGLEDVKWINLPSYKDSRGILTSIESRIDTSFSIKRIFYMHHIVSDRGGHAHPDTDQIVIACSGSFKIDLYDSKKKMTYQLKDATKGLYIPKMIFARLYNFSKKAVCLVLASTYYDNSKVIRSWKEYIRLMD